MLNEATILLNLPSAADFANLYVAVRHREGRMFNDDEVGKLPTVPASHAHNREWRLRHKSADRLKRYLLSKEQPLHILELGCGNGWLCNFLAAIPTAKITGMDINLAELRQARRVFGHLPNVVFTEGGPLDINARDRFDVIVFASVLQYFPSPVDLLRGLMKHLTPRGEIHIIDTFFYTPEVREMAAERSARYYESIGFPAMSQFYFHHSMDDLDGLNYRVRFNPRSVVSRLLRARTPFPWISITK